MEPPIIEIESLDGWLHTPSGQYLLAWEQAQLDRVLADLFGFHALQDLVVLPHTLDLSQDPHATLREVYRVLVPEGKVVVCGFNPASWWGLRQRWDHTAQRLGMNSGFLPQAGEFIGYWRLRDWMRLLGLEIQGGRFGCYRPAVQSSRWLDRFAWMDAAGDRWWPILGAVYLLVASKRVHGMRLIQPGWRAARSSRVAAVTTVGSGRVASDE